MKRHALKQVAEGDAADDGRHRGAQKERPVPGSAPLLGGNLAAIVKGEGTQDERKKQNQHRPVEAGKCRGVDERPGGEHGAASGDEPHLIAVPVRRDGIDHAAPLGVGFSEKGQQRSHAHVLAVHDGEAREENADEKPPEDLQNVIVDHDFSPYARRSKK